LPINISRSREPESGYHVVSISKEVQIALICTALLNPVEDQIVLLVSQDLNGLFACSITSANGQLVWQGATGILNGGQYKLLLKENVRAGTYFLKVKNTRQTFNFKLIKK
jgi:hypothetical protein